jgi:creatinine amidohydrolase
MFGAGHPQCRAAFFTWWTMAGKELAEVRESAPFGVGHGCEFETSVMLRCRPDSVRRSLIEGLNFVPSLDWADGDMLRAARGYVYRPLSDTSGGKGYVGDPSLASAEKGEAITTIVVDRLADIVKSLAAS